MKLSALILLGTYAISFAQPPVRSPEVAPDRKATFRLLAPKANEVGLRADFLKAPELMQRDAAGLWTLTVGPLEPDIYAYEYVVDGVRTLDPTNPSLKYAMLPMQNSSWVEVPASGPMFYDARPVPHGEVHIRWYRSKSLDGERRLHIYTPPDYGRSTTRYPVLYLLHGAGGDDGVWTEFGHANLMMDNLLADGKIAPFVVVMPFGYAAAPTPTWGSSLSQDRQRSGFVKDLLEDVIPFVESNYRVQTGRDQRAIAGLSMGGGQALTIGLEHPELFSRVAGFSAGLTQSVARFTPSVADSAKVNAQFKLIWVGCGRDDRLFGANKEFSDLLDKNGIRHTFRATEGSHTWEVWRRYLHEVSPLLFPRGRGL